MDLYGYLGYVEIYLARLLSESNLKLICVILFCCNQFPGTVSESYCEVYILIVWVSVQNDNGEWGFYLVHPYSIHHKFFI